MAKLQNGYMKLDVLLGEWRRVLERLERGELTDFRERYEAVLRPLEAAEDSLRTAVGADDPVRPLAQPLREFAREERAPAWT